MEAKEKKYTKLTYRAAIHKILATKCKAKKYGGWTKEKADQIFDLD